MQFQQIRGATVVVTFGDKTFRIENSSLGLHR